MRVHSATRRVGLLIGIFAGMVIGAALKLFAEIRGFAANGDVLESAESVIRQWDWRWDSWLEGALAGGFVGAFAWMLSKPRIRLAPWARAVIRINCAAWIAFLVFTPQVDAARFEEIAKLRADVDRSSLGVSFPQDLPTILASRYVGGYRPVSWPEIWLFLMAGPAAVTAEQYVVPDRYAGSRPTRGESYVIALIAFVVSTAFWASLSEAIRSLWIVSRRSAQTERLQL